MALIRISMKFSNNYILYPNNWLLEQAIEHYKSLLTDQIIDTAPDCSPDNGSALRDNFIHTRGNYEQHRYSTAVFENACDILESTVTAELLEQAPSDWAKAHNSLGNILAALAQQQKEPDLYAKAIASFNSALEVFNPQTTPLDWATTQYNLGTVMQALGRQVGDAKMLKSSVDAYTNALQEWSREQTPQQWSSTMYQLGATFHTHGSLLKGNRTFQKSVVAYNNALAELDADNYALELVATHNNRAAVLHNLAESEENAERLEEAIQSYETALTVCMEQQLPFHLAVLCRVNKSTALARLAELTKDAAIAETAADDFEVIIECFDNALQPLCLKHCQQQLRDARSMQKAFI